MWREAAEDSWDAPLSQMADRPPRTKRNPAGGCWEQSSGRGSESKVGPGGDLPRTKRDPAECHGEQRWTQRATCGGRPGSPLQDKTVLKTFETLLAQEMWWLFEYYLGQVCCMILLDCMQKQRILLYPSTWQISIIELLILPSPHIQSPSWSCGLWSVFQSQTPPSPTACAADFCG